MPMLTVADAVIKAANDLSTALHNQLPQRNITTEAIGRLMEIFKQTAETSDEDEQAQRLQVEAAAVWRVHGMPKGTPVSNTKA